MPRRVGNFSGMPIFDVSEDPTLPPGVDNLTRKQCFINFFKKYYQKLRRLVSIR